LSFGESWSAVAGSGLPNEKRNEEKVRKRNYYTIVYSVGYDKHFDRDRSKYILSHAQQRIAVTPNHLRGISSKTTTLSIQTSPENKVAHVK
jgi:hypothetical protein